MAKVKNYRTLSKRIESELKTAHSRMLDARRKMVAVLRREDNAAGVTLCQEMASLIVLETQVQVWSRLARPLQSGELNETQQAQIVRAIAAAAKTIRIQAAFDVMGDSVSTSQFSNVAQATALRATLQIVSEDGWLWTELEKWR